MISCTDYYPLFILHLDNISQFVGIARSNVLFSFAILIIGRISLYHIPSCNLSQHTTLMFADASFYLTNNKGSELSLPIHMDNVGCYGTEPKLINCSYHSDTSEDNHSEDVAVICSDDGGIDAAQRATIVSSVSLVIVILCICAVVVVILVIAVLYFRKKRKTGTIETYV